ncbi:MAG: TrbM/KikA/MpfK family conjugal transfer protein [Pseudomonadota bacterium]
MQVKTIFASAVLVIAASSISGTAFAQQELNDEQTLACEAILCLAAPHRPGECTRSIKRYFSISHKRIWDTIKARGNFLKLCPTANGTPKMEALVDAMANGAGRCNAEEFNSTLIYQIGNIEETRYVISSGMPAYCSVYARNEYTNLAGTLPRYVGREDDGGYWVEPGDYERALKEYNTRRNITFGDN